MIERWVYIISVPTQIADDPELWEQLKPEIEPDYSWEDAA